MVATPAPVRISRDQAQLRNSDQNRERPVEFARRSTSWSASTGTILSRRRRKPAKRQEGRYRRAAFIIWCWKQPKAGRNVQLFKMGLRVATSGVERGECWFHLSGSSGAGSRGHVNVVDKKYCGKINHRKRFNESKGLWIIKGSSTFIIVACLTPR